MSAPKAPVLPAPDLEIERPMRLSGRWADDLCLWLGRPLGCAGALGWPVLLIPELIDERLRLPEQSLQAYHAISWAGEVPQGDFTVGARVAWVSGRLATTEVALRSYARLGGEEVATSLLVARTPGEAPSWGRRELASAPQPTQLVRRRSFVAGEAEVEGFAGIAGTRYWASSDLHYAWGRGYPNVLVPGMVLLLIQLHFAGAGRQGGIEMWFRRPVPAGCLLEACQSEDDPRLWALRIVATGEAAAVARMSADGESK